ncbi:MAG: M1 family aminopeptidase [Acidobacteriota bacterium]
MGRVHLLIMAAASLGRPVFPADLYQVSLLPGRGEARVRFRQDGEGSAVERVYRSGDDDRTLRVELGGSYLFPASGWDRFAGSRRGPFRIEVRTRSDETVLASGRLAGVTRHENGFSTTIWSGDHEDRGVGLFLLTSKAAPAAASFSQPRWAKEILDDVVASLSRVFGPQPGRRPQVITLDLPLPLAKAFPGLLILDRRLASGPMVPPAGRIATVAHEAAHLWWANHVGLEGPGAASLQEGLAEFGAARALGDILGEASEAAHWRTLRNEYLLSSEGMVEAGISLTSGDDRPFRRAVRYARAAWVIRMLQARVGAQAFHLALVRFTRAGDPLTWEKLLAALERLASVDLTFFRSGWVSGTGHPDLYLRTDPHTGRITAWNRGQGGGEVPVQIRCGREGVARTVYLSLRPGQSRELPGVRDPGCHVEVDPQGLFLHGGSGPRPVPGLTLAAAWGHPVIRAVAPQSRAARSRLEAGDLVLEADHEPLNEADVEKLMNMLTKRDRVHLRIRRGNVEMEKTYIGGGA